VSVLAHKIARAKWEQKPELDAGEIAADAVTADLRTVDNTLSFWRCSTAAPDDVKCAMLALAATADRLDRLDVVYLEEKAVHNAGLATSDTPGKTPVVSLRELHVDIVRLDLVRLGAVARMVADAHRTNATLSMTKKEVLDLVVGAVRGKLVGVEDLKGEMRTKVEARLDAG
jgi:hypothetical protein